MGTNGLKTVGLVEGLVLIVVLEEIVLRKYRSSFKFADHTVDGVDLILC